MKAAGVVLVVLAACGGGSASAPAPNEPPMWERPGLAGASRPEWGPPQAGDPAPDFDMVGLRGERARLAAMRGSWVFLHFTATWCPFCDAEFDRLGDIATAYAPYGLKVVVVDVLESAAKWEPYARTRVGPAVIALHDEKGDLARRYAPPHVQPSFTDRAEAIFDATLLIDPEGTIRLFLIQDSAHFDPTFKAVRRELEGMMGIDAGREARRDATSAGRAGERARAPLLAPENVVAVEVVPPPPVVAGESGEVLVKLHVASGYHVMSNTPSAPNYIATRVAVSDREGVTAGNARFPAAQAFQLTDKSISTFFGDVDVRVPVTIAKDATPGERAVQGTVRYQACTESSCLLPVTRPFEAKVNVTRAPLRPSASR